MAFVESNEAMVTGESGGRATAAQGIALPNARSIALHGRLGFHKVAHFEQVGRKQDRWIDVGYWQRLF